MTVAGSSAGTIDFAPAEEPASLRERKKLRTWLALHDAARSSVLEHGIDGTTIEGICGQAEVSPRTFFNYFPSKAAAALGLHAPELDPEVLAAFRAGDGAEGLIDDLCGLIASTIRLPPDRVRTKELVEHRPELAPAIHSWMAELRDAVVGAAAERVGEQRGRLAVTLVTAALAEAVHAAPPSSVDELAGRLRATVQEFRELAGA
jgi:AcrR family transcriptional regulator